MVQIRRNLTGDSLRGFRAEGALVNGTVTYTWKDTSGQEHMLSLAYAAVPGQAQVNTEWYVPGYVATTLPVGADIAYSIIYAKGNSPPVPSTTKLPRPSTPRAVLRW